LLLLAIDTATDRGGLALVEGERVLGEVCLATPGTYLQHLLPSLDSLLDQAGRRLEDLQGLVVSQGPGNFTGLRIGLATAKALAWALGTPLAAVSTFAVLAAACTGQELPVGVLVDAKRQEVYFGRYDCRGAWPQPRQEPERLALADVPRRLTSPLLLTGPGLTVHAARLRAELAADIRFAPEELRLPKTEILARLGAHLLARGEGSSLESLTPTYLRPAL
jgi:tRNA threonylcarbamoyladenosine biosynthesis protein TsaB